jgi:hypothetical protein
MVQRPKNHDIENVLEDDEQINLKPINGESPTKIVQLDLPMIIKNQLKISEMTTQCS